MFQPRGAFSLTVVTVCLLSCASGRRLNLHAGLVNLNVENTESRSTVSEQIVKERNSISADGWLGETLLSRGAQTGTWGHKKLDVSTEIMVRECVGERAQHWTEKQERLGITVDKPTNVDAPIKLVSEIFKVNDQIAAADGIRNMFNKDLKQWKKDRAHAMEGLRKWGFGYDEAWDRCADGATDDAYECMVESAPGDDLKAKVRRHIDASDFLAHERGQRYFWNKKGQDEKVLVSEIQQLEKDLAAANYNWKESEKSCKQALSDKVKLVQARVLEELGAAQKDEEGICREKEDEMCPEGTYATTSRRWDMVKGSVASGTAFLVAKFTILPLGTLIGSAFGPAGATAGFLAGNALVTPLALAAGYFASRGPKECACFPRECSYNSTLGMCSLDSSVEPASKNPFAPKLAQSGMKCAITFNKEEECSLQQCTLEDYEHSKFGVAKLFGIVGQHDKNLYNCLSTNPTQTGTLAAVPVLPDGQNNTIAERNQIFTQLLKPASSASVDASDEPASNVSDTRELVGEGDDAARE